MHRMRMIADGMVNCGQAKTNSSSEEEQSKYDPVVRISFGIVFFCVWV